MLDLKYWPFGHPPQVPVVLRTHQSTGAPLGPAKVADPKQTSADQLFEHRQRAGVRQSSQAEQRTDRQQPLVLFSEVLAKAMTATDARTK